MKPRCNGWTIPSKIFFSFACLFLMSAASAIEPPSKGDLAPDFKLPVVGEDRYVSLQELCRSGPIVLVVLRGFPGYQCPLCTQQVGTLRNRVKALGEVTEHVLLIYPALQTALKAMQSSSWAPTHCLNR